MNEFLTWNNRFVQQCGVKEFIAFIWLCIIFITMFGWVFYHFCKLIGWIDRKFFTVYEWELDDIDANEKQK